MINRLTTILGFIIIIAAAGSVFYIDKITWSDAVFGGFFGVMLIYVKNSGIQRITEEFLTSKNK